MESVETVADVVKELRGYAYGFPDYMRLPMTFGTLRRYLKRIEAADAVKKSANATEGR